MAGYPATTDILVVHGIRTLLPVLALAALLAAAPASFAAGSDAPDQLIVGFSDGTSRAESKAIVAETDGSIERRLPGGVAVVTAEAGAELADVADALESDSDVKYATPNFTVRASGMTNDPLLQDGSAWSLLRMHVPDAWGVADGAGTTVAVLDGGVSPGNADLSPNLWTNPNETPDNGVDDDNNGFVDDVHGADWVDRDGQPDDQGGHGTHVAGTIAAVAGNGFGSAGVAPNTKIMPLRFLDRNGAGTIADALGAIDYAISQGADVINASWGGPDFAPPLKDAVARAGNAGITFVAAAGNDGLSNDTDPTYPASFGLPNVISVAASDKSDRLADFSNYGKSVDVAAPGTNILSTVGDAFGQMSGTSMASPQVAGIAAVLRSANKSLAPAAVKAAIMAGARTNRALSGKIRFGGVADAAGALNAIGAGIEVTRDTSAPSRFKLRKPGKKIRVRSKNTKVRFSWSRASDDNLIGYELVVNGKVRATVKTNHARVRVPVGKIKWSVVAIDSEGNRRKADTSSASTGRISVMRAKRR